jgi:hypothetical protein
MTKIKYNGQELQPITKPQIFDPPKEMLVWDSVSQEPRIALVWSIAPESANFEYPIRCVGNVHYAFCAEIPEEPKQKRATNKELAEWCAKGNGQIHYAGAANVHSFYSYQNEDDDSLVTPDVYIRKFGDTEWVAPTLENMGMEAPVPVEEKL